ncbi:MAG: class B sortase, partial [Bacillota bacterium]|nr:class B sortase [Bacillota bacterium]
MKAEIFSIRVNEEETGALNSHFDDITKVLLANNVEVLYKTEIDNDRNKLEQAMQKSAAEAEALDMVILANFSDSKDETSLLNQFGSYISKVFYDKPNKNEINPPSDVNSPQPAYSLGDMGNGYHGFVFTYHNITVVALPCASLCEKSVSLLIANGTLLSMAAINPERFSIHPTYVVNNEGLLKRKGKRKKVKWYSYLVPVKGDPLSEVLRKTVVIASSIVLFVSVYLILNIMVIQPEQNAQSDNNIQQIANGNSNNNSGNADETLGNSNSSLKGANAELVKDWSALAKINTDIIGWITQPQTVINYPVLASSSDNSSTQFYLYRNYEKADDIFGSIFKDYRSSDGINSRNIVLHGHNMLNGSRFASIVKYGNRYGGSLSYYQAHPIIYFDTPQWNGERSEWKIIAEFKIQVSQKQY